MLETKTDLKSEVIRHLHKGKQNALTGKILAQRLGEKDTRRIRLAIEDLIEQDKQPICFVTKKDNAPSGYFIAETPKEVDECKRIIKYSYGIKLFKHYYALERAKQERFSGQMSLRI